MSKSNGCNATVVLTLGDGAGDCDIKFLVDGEPWHPDPVVNNNPLTYTLTQQCPPGWGFYGISFWGEQDPAEVEKPQSRHPLGGVPHTMVSQLWNDGWQNGVTKFAGQTYVDGINVNVNPSGEITFTVHNPLAINGRIGFHVTFTNYDNNYTPMFTSRDPEIPLRRNDG